MSAFWLWNRSHRWWFVCVPNSSYSSCGINLNDRCLFKAKTFSKANFWGRTRRCTCIFGRLIPNMNYLQEHNLKFCDMHYMSAIGNSACETPSSANLINDHTITSHENADLWRSSSILSESLRLHSYLLKNIFPPKWASRSYLHAKVCLMFRTTVSEMQTYLCI